MKDNHSVVESADHTESECFHKGEKCQETEVRRMTVALPVQQTQDNEGPKEGHIEGPYAATTSMNVEKRTIRSTHWFTTQAMAEGD